VLTGLVGTGLWEGKEQTEGWELMVSLPAECGPAGLHQESEDGCSPRVLTASMSKVPLLWSFSPLTSNLGFRWGFFSVT
jgi:hypothetical protein